MITLVRLSLHPYFLLGVRARTLFLMMLCCLVASCGGGGSGGESISNNCGISDCSPKAQISPPSITAYAGQTVELDGSRSTPNGSLIYRWQQISGLNVAVENADKAIASFVLPTLDVEQSLTFRLIVTRGNSDSTAELVVIAKPLTVSANASTTTADVGQPVILQAVGGDDSGENRYLWEQVAPKVALEIKNATSSVASFKSGSVTSASVETFRATLTNKFGAIVKSEVNVNLAVGTIPSITAIFPSETKAGAEIKVSGSGFLDAEKVFLRSDIAVLPIGYKVFSNHEIRLVIPPETASGQYAIEVQNSGGTTQENFIVGEPLRGVKDIAAGEKHYCVVTTEGKVNCWGDNRYGQLGNGSKISAWHPVAVRNGTGADLFNVKAISSGISHNCALKENSQEILCWGRNAYGELGDGSWSNRAFAAPVVWDESHLIQSISAGGFHSAAFVEGGLGYVWGGELQQIGGLRLESNAPRSISLQGKPLLGGTFGSLGCLLEASASAVGAGLWWCIPSSGLDGIDAISFAVGQHHSCALVSSDDNSVRCSGTNKYGQLGNASYIDSSSPVAVRNSIGDGLLSNVKSIYISESSGVPMGGSWDDPNLEGSTTCAQLNSGGVYCWGKNSFGQLGNGSYATSSIPVKVEGLEDVSSLALSGTSGCAILKDGTVRCWGGNDFGELGRSAYGNKPAVVDYKGVLNAKKIYANGDNEGRDYSCVLLEMGAAYCWGHNNFGQLGNGLFQHSAAPVPVGLTGITSLSAGAGHVCAISAGDVYCWGNNRFGQLGLSWSVVDKSAVPILVHGLSKVIFISAGENRTCALDDKNSIFCWGDGAVEPFKINGLPAEQKIAEISVGGGHSCALSESGKVYCWGSNNVGQLGNGILSDAISDPVEVVFPAGSVAANISVAIDHSCAALLDRRVFCWGGNNIGQLDTNVPLNYMLEQVSGIDDALSVSVASLNNESYACILQAHNNGNVSCWGANRYGQLGIGLGNDHYAPVAIKGLLGVKQVAIGPTHACALYHDGYVACWGAALGGQLGQAPLSPRTILQ